MGDANSSDIRLTAQQIMNYITSLGTSDRLTWDVRRTSAFTAVERLESMAVNALKDRDGYKDSLQVVDAKLRASEARERDMEKLLLVIHNQALHPDPKPAHWTMDMGPALVDKVASLARHANECVTERAKDKLAITELKAALDHQETANKLSHDATAYLLLQEEVERLWGEAKMSEARAKTAEDALEGALKSSKPLSESDADECTSPTITRAFQPIADFINGEWSESGMDYVTARFEAEAALGKLVSQARGILRSRDGYKHTLRECEEYKEARDREVKDLTTQLEAHRGIIQSQRDGWSALKTNIHLSLCSIRQSLGLDNSTMPPVAEIHTHLPQLTTEITTTIKTLRAAGMLKEEFWEAIRAEIQSMIQTLQPQKQQEQTVQDGIEAELVDTKSRMADLRDICKGLESDNATLTDECRDWKDQVKMCRTAIRQWRQALNLPLIDAPGLGGPNGILAQFDQGLKDWLNDLGLSRRAAEKEEHDTAMRQVMMCKDAIRQWRRTFELPPITADRIDGPGGMLSQFDERLKTYVNGLKSQLREAEKARGEAEKAREAAVGLATKHAADKATDELRSKASLLDEVVRIVARAIKL